MLVVADTYNHRLKVVKHPIEQGETVTWAGAATTGDAAAVDGTADVATFAEPSGLALDPAHRRVLVADTNHHAIRAVSIPDGAVGTLKLLFGTEDDTPAAGEAAAPARVRASLPDPNGVGVGWWGAMPRLTVALAGRCATSRRWQLAEVGDLRLECAALPRGLRVGQRGTLAVTVQPADQHITAWAPSRYQAVLPGQTLRWQEPSGGNVMDWTTVENPDDAHIREATLRLPFAVAGAGAGAVAEVDLALYFCSDSDGLCVSETSVVVLTESPTATAPAGDDLGDVPVLCRYKTRAL